jgi:hypothetical protein
MTTPTPSAASPETVIPAAAYAFTRGRPLNELTPDERERFYRVAVNDLRFSEEARGEMREKIKLADAHNELNALLAQHDARARR